MYIDIVSVITVLICFFSILWFYVRTLVKRVGNNRKTKISQRYFFGAWCKLLSCVVPFR